LINDGQSAGHRLRLDELSLQTSEVLILGWAKWYHFNELAIRALMESNMAVAVRSQTAGVSRPLAGPSQTAGVSNICANYEDLLADFH
jgi:hypothetical protein